MGHHNHHHMSSSSIIYYHLNATIYISLSMSISRNGFSARSFSCLACSKASQILAFLKPFTTIRRPSWFDMCSKKSIIHRVCRGFRTNNRISTFTSWGNIPRRICLETWSAFFYIIFYVRVGPSLASLSVRSTGYPLSQKVAWKSLSK